MRCKSLTTLVLLLGAFPFAGHQEQPGKPVAEAELLMRPVANLSRQLFEGLFEVARSRYPGDMRLLFDNLEGLLGFVQLVSDLYRDYGEDYRVIVQALADLTATTSDKEELEELSPIPRALDSFCELLEQFRSSPEADRIEIFHRVATALEEVRSHMRNGLGVSHALLRKTFAILGPQVHGKPGRRPQEYSFEYDLKAAGLSWAQVAKRSLEKRPEFREEFANKTFEDLDYRQQTALRQWIRVGVESYARRAMRPYPPRSLSPAKQGDEEKVS